MDLLLTKGREGVKIPENLVDVIIIPKLFSFDLFHPVLSLGIGILA